MPTLLLNGKSVQVDAAPDTPLLWVLRDHLQLTGTKFGCGAAHCGACTVHIDGVAIRSCVTPLSAVAGKRVTSIEGLQSRVGLAVQAAWDKHQVPVRLLPVGSGHDRGRAARQEREADGHADCRGDAGQHLPLRNVRSHSGGRP